MINSLFAASFASSVVTLFLIATKRFFIQMIGSIWYYYLWFILLIPWCIVWLPLPHFPFEPSTLHIYSSQSVISRSIYLASTHVLSLSENWLIGIWLLGFLCIGVYYCSQEYLFSKAIRKSAVKLDEVHINCLKTLLPKRDFHLFKAIQLSSHIVSPMVCHYRRSKIYLPENFFELYSLDEKRYALTHEIVHYRRKDILANCMMLLLKCINWFNPVFYLNDYFFRTAQEVACDAVVSRDYSAMEKKAYGMALLKTAILGSSKIQAISCAWNQALQLKERFIMLKLHNRAQRYTCFGLLFFVLIFLFSFMAPHVETYLSGLMFPRMRFIADAKYDIDNFHAMLVGNVQLMLSKNIKIYSDRVLIKYADDRKKVIAACEFNNAGMIMMPKKFISFKSGSLDPNAMQFLGDKMREMK